MGTSIPPYNTKSQSIRAFLQGNNLRLRCSENTINITQISSVCLRNIYTDIYLPWGFFHTVTIHDPCTGTFLQSPEFKGCSVCSSSSLGKNYFKVLYYTHMPVLITPELISWSLNSSGVSSAYTEQREDFFGWNLDHSYEFIYLIFEITCNL